MSQPATYVNMSPAKLQMLNTANKATFSYISQQKVAQILFILMEFWIVIKAILIYLVEVVSTICAASFAIFLLNDITTVTKGKAFDTVSYSKLIYKLHSCGIRGTLLLWLKYFSLTVPIKLGSDFADL